jgi:hypothetical protein
MFLMNLPKLLAILVPMRWDELQFGGSMDQAHFHGFLYDIL